MNDVTFGKFILSAYDDALIVTDAHIAALYGFEGDNVYFLPRGETAKSFEEVEKLCKWFLSKNLRKDGKVVAVGGGSIGDSVGFACAVYKRGVYLLHVPTTLLAMVDSSVGGKTALDLNGVKNAVGVYNFFCDTLIDVRFLQTLTDEQLNDGLGEILKYRMLDDGINGMYLSASQTDVISACVAYKQNICRTDPYCKGVREKLNFGHTIGHAMELALGVSHGVAVANGIYYETLLAERLRLCSSSYAENWYSEVKKHFEIYPLTDEMLTVALQDKKNVGVSGVCEIAFVLPPAFETVNIALSKLKTLLK